MKRKHSLLGVVFTAALLSATLGESTLSAAAKPLQENWETRGTGGELNHSFQTSAQLKRGWSRSKGGQYDTTY